MTSTFRLAALLAAATLFAGCSGTHGTPLPALQTTPSGASHSAGTSNAGHARGHVTVRVRIPKRKAARKGHYISASTQGLTMTFNGAASFAQSAGLTPSSPGCSGVPLTCTFTVALVPGSYHVTVETYDQAPAGGTIPVGAHGLSIANSIPVTVNAGSNNSLGLTLDGIPASIAVGSFPTETAGMPLAATPFTVTAYDAGNNAIVGTYASPILLDDLDTSGHTTIATSGPDNPPTRTLLSSADTATIAYDGALISNTTIHASDRTASGSGAFALQHSVFVVDELDQVIDRMPESCTSTACITQIGGQFSLPGGIALDPAGNAYVTTGSSAAIQVIPLGCTSLACVTALGGGFNANGMDAVGPANAVYAPDFGHQAVKMVPAGCATASCVVAIGGTFPKPTGVAVDSSGNTYVADESATTIFEIPSGCTTNACVTSIGGGFNEPSAVAVDGSGNVYVDDYMNSAVKEIPSGCTMAACVTTIGGGFVFPMSLTLDPSGNVIVGDTGTGRVKKVPPGCTSSACVTTIGGGYGSVLGVAVY